MLKHRYVVDFNWYGHIPMYHVQYLQAFAGIAENLVSFSPAGAELAGNSIVRGLIARKQLCIGKAVGSILSPAQQVAKVQFCRAASSFVWRRLRKSSMLRDLRAARRWQVVAQLNSDMLSRPPKTDDRLWFFPYLDDMFFGKSEKIIDELPWAGIFMGAASMLGAGERTEKKYLGMLRSRGLRYLLTLDDRAKLLIERINPKLHVRTVPDITNLAVDGYDRETISNIIRFARGRKIVCLLGHLTEKKNVGAFCKAALDSDNSDLFFVLMGRCDFATLPREERLWIERARQNNNGNIYVSIGAVKMEDTLNKIIDISAAVYVRYKNFEASSNILTKAAAFGKPVYATNLGAIGSRVVDYRLGTVAPGDAIGSEYSMMRKVAFEKRGFSEAGAAAYAKMNSYEKLCEELSIVDGR